MNLAIRRGSYTNGHRLLLTFTIGAFLIGQPPLAWAQEPSHPVLDAPGFQQNRDYFSEMPFEHIDTLTGSLILRFTDLVLPGNAGRELRFQRTYNSKTGAWAFGIAGIAMQIVNPAPPPVFGPDPQQVGTPTLVMSDGSHRMMAWYTEPDLNDPSSLNKAISSEFWLFDRTGTTRRLSIPNGDTCDYEADSAATLRVTSCSDSFGNTIGFQWMLALDPPELRVTQTLSTSVSRLITVVLQP